MKVYSMLLAMLAAVPNLDNDVARSEIGEVIIQLALYAGWPRAFFAATAVKAMNLPE